VEDVREEEALAPAVLQPDGVPEWAESWPVLPPQPGLSAGQELVGALASRAVFAVEADVSALGAVDAEIASVLVEELAADPRWKVTRWAGQLVAFARLRQGDGWSVGWGGYGGRDPMARVALWFGEPPWRPEAKPNLVEPPDQGAIRLNAAGWPLGGHWEGHTGALLAVKGPVLALEVHEIATDLQLVRTARALSRVPMRLEEAVLGLPSRHPVADAGGAAEAVWVAGRDSNGIDLRVLVTPPAAGWTWVRLVRAGEAVEERLVLRASLERLGAGDAPQAGQSFLPLPALANDVVAEVWFMADGGGAPERLLSVPLVGP
jgi:hypothetical protein